jgi:hypothetical protein
MLTVANNGIILIVVMLNVIMLSVVVTWIALWKCQDFNFSKVHLHVRFNIAFLN